jgi:DNA-directed RNA polymerase specialized sigma24 family protein
MRLRLMRRYERAFERSYRRYVPDVYHYALGVLRDPLDAEEVTQTTFLNAYREFRRKGAPPPRLNSLLAIAHEVCLLRGGHLLIAADFFVEEERTSAADVLRALGRLPFDQRAVLVMREVEGRTYAEIAQIIALPVAAVETLIFRGRRELRELLEGSLTCHEAELAISRALDGRLSRNERGPVSTHLRSCDDCSGFARSQEAQREALRALAAVPLPETLQSFFGMRRADVPLRTAARISALARTAPPLFALTSSGGAPNHPGFIGEEQEPEADAAVVKQKQARRKFDRPAASP